MAISFCFKGLSPEDRIYPKTPEESAKLAKGTMYEAWFDTLKVSPWYNKIAKTGEFPSDRARETWQHFGDLRQVSFTTWWKSTGFNIFAEKVPYRPIAEANIQHDVLRDEKDESKPPILRLDIPLNLSPQELERQFKEILSKHRNYLGEVEYERWRHSTAEVGLSRDAKLYYTTIKQSLDLFVSYERLKQERDITLHEFAFEMKLIPGKLKGIKDRRLLFADVEYRTSLSNAARDRLKVVRNIMANATELDFPNPERHRWTTAQTD